MGRDAGGHAPGAGVFPVSLWMNPIATQAYRRELCWHVVALQLALRFRGADKPVWGLYTGFFWEQHGRLAWVTAGHCLDEAREILGRADLVDVRGWWHDHYASTVKDAAMIPVDVRSLLDRAVVSAAPDLAIVRPNWNEEKLLRANEKFKPLGAEHRGDFGLRPPDQLLLVGFPSKWKQEWKREMSAEATHFVRMDAACLPARLLSKEEIRRERGAFWSHEAAVYGEVKLPDMPPYFDLDTIGGMSGGPVFGVRYTGDESRLLVACVGVQSSWLERSRMIRAESVETLIAFAKSGS